MVVAVVYSLPPELARGHRHGGSVCLPVRDFKEGFAWVHQHVTLVGYDLVHAHHLDLGASHVQTVDSMQVKTKVCCLFLFAEMYFPFNSTS